MSVNPLNDLRNARSHDDPPSLDSIKAAAAGRHRRRTRIGAAALATVASLALAGGVLGFSGDDSVEGENPDVAEWSPPRASSDQNRFLRFMDAADEVSISATFEEMSQNSDWVVMGRIIDVTEGRAITPEDSTTLRFAEVHLAVTEELAGQASEAALVENTEGQQIARIEFAIGAEDASLDDFASLLPDGDAMWFLHQKTGEGEESFYRLEDTVASLVVADPDGTVGLPFALPEEEGIELPDELNDENADDAAPAQETDPTFAGSLDFEYVRAAATRQ